MTLNFGLLTMSRKPSTPLLRELLQPRQQAGLTQAEVAARMGTKAPAVTRLEAALADSRHSPTIATLKKYAQAVGCTLEVHLVPGTAR